MALSSKINLPLSEREATVLLDLIREELDAWESDLPYMIDDAEKGMEKGDYTDRFELLYRKGAVRLLTKTHNRLEKATSDVKVRQRLRMKSR